MPGLYQVAGNCNCGPPVSICNGCNIVQQTLHLSSTVPGFNPVPLLWQGSSLPCQWKDINGVYVFETLGSKFYLYFTAWPCLVPSSGGTCSPLALQFTLSPSNCPQLYSSYGAATFTVTP